MACSGGAKGTGAKGGDFWAVTSSGRYGGKADMSLTRPRETCEGDRGLGIRERVDTWPEDSADLLLDGLWS